MKTLEPENIEFRQSAGGRLDAILDDGTVVENVQCLSLFPLRDPENSISVAHGRGNERRELGIIKHLTDFPMPQQELVRKDIRFRYFLPEITDIRKIVNSAGIDEWHVVTDRGEKIFYLSGRKENITVSNDGMILITDMDKCRYRISSTHKLSPTARSILERAIP